MKLTDPSYETKAHLLVPVELPDPGRLSQWLLEFLGPLDVLVLGTYLVKEQASPEQVRNQFGEKAAGELEEVAERFRDATPQITLSTRLVFTQDVVETIDRVAEEENVDVVLVPAEVDEVASLLVLVTGELDLERMHRFIAALLRHRGADVTLLRIVESVGSGDESARRAEAEDELDNLEQQLVADDVERERIETRTMICEDTDEACLEVAGDFDLVVMDPARNRLRDRLLLEHPCPVIVVRQRTSE